MPSRTQNTINICAHNEHKKQQQRSLRLFSHITLYSVLRTFIKLKKYTSATRACFMYTRCINLIACRYVRSTYYTCCTYRYIHIFKSMRCWLLICALVNYCGINYYKEEEEEVERGSKPLLLCAFSINIFFFFTYPARYITYICCIMYVKKKKN